MQNVENLKDILDEVFEYTIQNFFYVTDEEKHDQEEYWESIPKDFNPEGGFTGDCEKFAMVCRKQLIDRDIESRLVACYEELGGGHLVLECEGYVLDNRMNRVVTKTHLEHVGYQWIAISGYEPYSKWYSLRKE